MNLPRINTYGQYSSGNYGAHCLVVEMNGVTVWFSYQTPVAFRVQGKGLVVRQNDWGPTTGKHLNFIDGGHRGGRVNAEEFEKQWKTQVLDKSTDNRVINNSNENQNKKARSHPD